MSSDLKRLRAPKGLDVEAESNGLALSSPRYSAWAKRGNSRGERRRSSIGPSSGTIGSAVGYSSQWNTASDQWCRLLESGLDTVFASDVVDDFLEIGL